MGIEFPRRSDRKYRETLKRREKVFHHPFIGTGIPATIQTTRSQAAAIV
jgi:hypothetical protein